MTVTLSCFSRRELVLTVFADNDKSIRDFLLARIICEIN